MARVCNWRECPQDGIHEQDDEEEPLYLCDEHDKRVDDALQTLSFDKILKCVCHIDKSKNRNRAEDTN